LSHPAPLLHRLGDAASRLGREPPKRPLLRVLVQVGLPLLVLGFLAYTVADQWSELREQDVSFELGWIFAALAALLAFHAGTGFAWLLALRRLGQTPNVVATQATWAKSLFTRYLPGGGVLFTLPRVVLTERLGVPRRVTVAALAYETTIGIAAACILAGGLALAEPEVIRPWLAALILAGGLAALACAHPAVLAPLLNRALRALGREDVPELIPLRRLPGLLGLYLGSFALSGVGMWCVARAIYPAAGADLDDFAAAQSLAFCAAVVAVVFPGGLGVREGVFAWAITPLVPGEEFAIAAAVALAGRLVWTVSEVGYFAIFSVASRRRDPRPAAPPTPLAGRDA
jgi:hypothetical protein